MRIRLLASVLILLAPLWLRQYCHMKSGSVAAYSDLYDETDDTVNEIEASPAVVDKTDAVSDQENKKSR